MTHRSTPFMSDVRACFKAKDLVRLETTLANHPREPNASWGVLWPAIWKSPWKEGVYKVLAHLTQQGTSRPIFVHVTASLETAFLTHNHPAPVEPLRVILDHLDWSDPKSRQWLSNLLNGTMASRYDQKDVELFRMILSHPQMVKHPLDLAGIRSVVFVQTMHEKHWEGAEDVLKLWQEKITPEELSKNIVFMVKLYADLCTLMPEQKGSDHIEYNVSAWLEIAKHKDDVFWQDITTHPLMEEQHDVLRDKAPSWVAWLEKKRLWREVACPLLSSTARKL